MEAATQKFPSFLLWSEIDKWTSTSSLLRYGDLPSDWRILPVHEFASQIENKERVEPDREYQMAGVRWYGEGVFHRETVLGKEQSASYLSPLKQNTIIYNRLFAWKESFAVVTPEFDGLYVSTEFPQFVIDENIALPKYIYLLFNSRKIIKAVNAASIGSSAVSRNRFKESDFLSFKVPIPPLPIQQKIVAYREKAQRSVSKTAQSSIGINEKILSRFLKSLGLSTPKKTIPPKCFTSSWNGFDRWSVSFNQTTLSMIDLTLGKYPVVELGSILELVQYGTSEKANTKLMGTPVLRMNNIKDGVFDYSKLKHVELPLRSEEALVLKDGDILINRTNSKELVGKCAVFHESNRYVFASYLIRLRCIEDKANPDYVAHIINSIIGRQQVDALSRQVLGQANINTQELRSLRIPLPSRDIQNALMKQIEADRSAMASTEQDSTLLELKTKNNVEKLILGTLSVEEL